MGRKLWALFGAASVIWAGSAQAERPIDGSLRKAAQDGDVAAVAQLLGEGADPNQSDALFAAVERGQQATADYLLAHGAKPNRWIDGRDRLPMSAEGSAVFAAAKAGNRRLLEDLKKRGADLDAESIQRETAGETSLIIAVRRGNVDAARLLVECGANANRKSANGDTALLEAVFARENAASLVKLLLAHGADPDIKDGQGKSARESSYWYGAAEIRQAIENAKPPKPFERPEEIEEIRQALLYKAACDQFGADYRAHVRKLYQHWAAPRTTVIRQIEANPDFQRQLIAAIEGARRSLSATEQSADRRLEEAKSRNLCEKQLPAEFAR